MKLLGREDMRLGREEAFEAVTDVAFLERQLLRRGIDVQRTDTADGFGPGATWAAKADWNGRTLPLTFEVAEMKPPECVLLHARSGGLSGDLYIQLAALSRKDTRIRATLTMQASGLRDRLFLNALTMTRARLMRRFSEVVTAFARGIEGRAGT